MIIPKDIESSNTVKIREQNHSTGKMSLRNKHKITWKGESMFVAYKLKVFRRMFE